MNILASYRFIVFFVTSVLNCAYFVACVKRPELVQLQGVLMTYDGIAGLLIGSKTITDVKGKAGETTAATEEV